MRQLLHPRLTDEEVEAQRGELSCPELYSQLVAELRFELEPAVS